MPFGVSCTWWFLTPARGFHKPFSLGHPFPLSLYLLFVCLVRLFGERVFLFIFMYNSLFTFLRGEFVGFLKVSNSLWCFFLFWFGLGCLSSHAKTALPWRDPFLPTPSVVYIFFYTQSSFLITCSKPSTLLEFKILFLSRDLLSRLMVYEPPIIDYWFIYRNVNSNEISLRWRNWIKRFKIS